MPSVRTPLPLARASGTGVKVPDASAIEKLFTIVTTPEAAVYFQQQLDSQFKSANLSDEFKAVTTEVDRFVRAIQAQTSTDSNYWSGDKKDAAVSIYKAFHASFGEKALKELQTQFSDQEIQFTFAMSHDSELLQGVTTKDGEPFSQEVTDQINDVFSSFLVKNGMMCKDGVIYHSEDGAIQSDDAGRQKRVDPEVYKNIFKAFPAYVKEQSGVTVVLNDVSATRFPETATAQS